MDWPTVTTVITVAVALVTLGFTAWSVKNQSGKGLYSEIERINARLDDCEEHHRDCEKGRAELQRENLRLMRKVLQLPDADGGC